MDVSIYTCLIPRMTLRDWRMSKSTCMWAAWRSCSWTDMSVWKCVGRANQNVVIVTHCTKRITKSPCEINLLVLMAYAPLISLGRSTMSSSDHCQRWGEGSFCLVIAASFIVSTLERGCFCPYYTSSLSTHLQDNEHSYVVTHSYQVSKAEFARVLLVNVPL